SFLESYRLSGNQEEYFCFLATKRLELSESRYISFASGEMEHYDLTMRLEQQMQKIRQEFVHQPEYLMLMQRKANREGSGKQQYYEESMQLCRVLKNSYRNSVGE
ncbi:MAG: hypothetical protein J6Z35_03895, partial [Lachnospiraceae bacterium]|nr:hypothetical protein [Lachnospiraceae bacterium]